MAEMYQSRSANFVCMLLDESDRPIGAEVIAAVNSELATEQAKELLGCCAALPTMASGYELWFRGTKIADGHA